MNKFKTNLYILLFLPVIFFFNSCEKATEPLNNSNIDLVYATDTNRYSFPVNDFQIDTVKMLTWNFKFLSAFNPDNIIEVKNGQVLLYFTGNAKIRNIVETNLPANSYRSLEFEVRKNTKSEPLLDPDFRDSLNTYSIIIYGRLLGKKFVHKSSVSISVKINFNDYQIINENEFYKIRINMNPKDWFIKGDTFLIPFYSFNAARIDSNIARIQSRNFAIEVIE